MLPSEEGEVAWRKGRVLPSSIVVGRALLTFLAVLGAIAIVVLAAYILANQTNPTEHLELLQDVKYAGKIPIRRYRTKQSGMTVTMVGQEGTFVSGHFCFPTEDYGEDGLAHATEHLIFAGSVKHPHSEFMPLLAPICLAREPNAFTLIDSTCFYFNAVNQAGFLRMVPVMTNHIFHPLLRSHDFLSEIHHVNQRGEDGGVMYAEMKEHESSPRYIMEEALRRHLYPGKEGGYAKNPFGATSKLRSSTTLEKIREYHERFYVPSRLHMMVFGKVDEVELARTINIVEHDIYHGKANSTAESDIPSGERRGRRRWRQHRPLTTVYPDLESSVHETVYYPGDNSGGTGTLVMAWRMPFRMAEDVERYHLVVALAEYLARSDLSPIRKNLESSSPPLSTSAHPLPLAYSQPSIAFVALNVNLGKMRDAERNIKRTLQRLQEEPFDLKRMRQLVQTQARRMEARLNSDLSWFLADVLRNFNLFSDPWGDVKPFLNDEKSLFLWKSGSFWKRLAKEVFSLPSVVLYVKPSKREMEKDLREEQSRISRRVSSLGESGLAQAGRALREALAEKRRGVPPDLLTGIRVTPATGIRFPEARVYNRSGALDSHAPTPPGGFDLQRVPYKFFMLDLKNGDTINIKVFFDFRDLPPLDWQYVRLMSLVWKDSPVLDDGGRLIPHEQLQPARDACLLFTFVGNSNNYLVGLFETTVANYSLALDTIRQLVFNVKFDGRKVEQVLTQRIDDYYDMMRQQWNHVSVVFNKLSYNEEFPAHATHFIAMHKFYNAVLQQFKSDPQSVLDRLEETRQAVLRPDKAEIYLAGDIEKLTYTYGATLVTEDWVDFLGTGNLSGGRSDVIVPIRPFSWSRYRATSLRTRRRTRHVMSVLPTTSDTCRMVQSVPLSLSDRDDCEYPAFSVAVQYVYSNLHRVVRGEGLAYSVFMNEGLTKGYVEMELDRCTNLVKSFELFQSLITNLTSHDAEETWNEDYVEAAKGHLIVNLVEGESLTKLPSKMQYLIQEGKDPLYERRLLSRLQSVSASDAVRAARKHLSAFTRVKESVIVAVCSGVELSKRVAREFARAQVEEEKRVDLTVVQDLANSIYAM